MCTPFVCSLVLTLSGVVGYDVSFAGERSTATKIDTVRSYDLNVGEDQDLDLNRQDLLETDMLGCVSHPTRSKRHAMDVASYVFHATGDRKLRWDLC